MVDRDQRLVARHRQRLGGDEADHHSADQARPGGRSHGVDIVQCHAGIGEDRLDQGGELFGMRSRRDLRHYAAIGAVRLVLGGDPLGDNRPIAAYQRGGGLVAGRFDAEYDVHPGLSLTANG